jgi:hypothetical protein
MSERSTDRGAIPRTSQAQRSLLEGEIRAPSGGILRPFKPGQTGNPQGIFGGSAYHEARRMCARATPEAVARQIELMRSDDERVAFMATDAIIRRGAGPIRDHSDEDAAVSRINLDSLSADERKALVSLLRRALGAT